jgi:hypothetical protein
MRPTTAGGVRLDEGNATSSLRREAGTPATLAASGVGAIEFSCAGRLAETENCTQ